MGYLDDEKQDDSPHPSFAAWLAATTRSLLTQNATDAAAPSDDLQPVIDAINAYLRLDGEEEVTLVPCDTQEVVRGLSAFLDINRLNQTQNVFNCGADAERRVESAEHNVALANLVSALDDALRKQKHPIMLEDGVMEAHALPADNDDVKVWKRTVEKMPDGTWQSSIEEVDHIDFEHTPIICAGGARCLHANPKTINGFMKQAELALGGLEIYQPGITEKPIELYAVSYPVAHRTRINAQTFAYNADPDTEISEQAQAFSDRFILPYLQGEAGERLPLKELKLHLRKFNFFAYSYGTCFVKEVCNALSQGLLNKGYSASQVREALAEVYAMNLNATCRLDDEKPCGNFSSIYVVSKQDATAQSRANYAKYFKHKEAQLPAVYPVSENELLIWTNHPKVGKVWQALNDVETTEANLLYPNPAPVLPDGKKKDDTSGHDVRLATSRTVTRHPEDPVADYYDPSFIEYSLRHASLRQDALGGVHTTFTPVRIIDGPKASFTMPGVQMRLDGKAVEVTVRKYAAVNDNEQSPAR
ncbi:MAG: hypothetical protein CMM94_07860 [Rickettsiales bacterium]|nr:hypothetical protein [Rickettsiales bacterium]